MINKELLRHTNFLGITLSALFKQCDWKKMDICRDFRWSIHTVDALLKGKDKKLSYYIQFFDLLLQYSDRNFYFIPMMRMFLCAIITKKTLVIGVREGKDQKVRKWVDIMRNDDL